MPLAVRVAAPRKVSVPVLVASPKVRRGPEKRAVLARVRAVVESLESWPAVKVKVPVPRAALSPI